MREMNLKHLSQIVETLVRLEICLIFVSRVSVSLQVIATVAISICCMFRILLAATSRLCFGQKLTDASSVHVSSS